MSADSVGRAFTGVAESSGMYIRYSLPGFLPVEHFIDSGGPVSQAVVSSDAAQSFSSLPYPGSTAIGAPGVFALVTEGAFVPPGYPFYVSAAHPTQPEQALSDPSGAYSLKASAKEGQATGDARVVPPGGGEAAKPVANARSVVVSEGEQVTATAESIAEAISAGPLSLGVVRSRSVTTYKKGDAKPESKSELTVEGGRAGDTSFSFGPQGLQVGQQGIPLPVGQGLTAINQAIAPAGLSIRFVEPAPLEGGQQAASLEITSVAQVPGAGVGTLRVRLGGAMSFISLGGEEASLGLEEYGSSTLPTDSGGSGSADSATFATEPPAADAGTASGLFTEGGGFAPGSAFTDPGSGAGFAGAGQDPGTGGAFGATPDASAAGPGGVVTPAQLAASPGGGVDAASNLAVLLVGAVMAGMGLLAVWLWTKRRPAWTL